MKSLLILTILTLLIGCEDRFRYPCQDPQNWNNSECKKPDCIPMGTCTESLIAKEKVEECK